MHDKAGQRIHRPFTKNFHGVLIAILLVFSTFLSVQQYSLQPARAQNEGSITPGRQWGVFFDTNGDLLLLVNQSGIAVRVELPREFTVGVVSGENDTSFIESDINYDYYYYAVWDEANHYSYKPEAPCFKPDASQYDNNAPICVEIWSTVNNTLVNFTAPRYIRFRELRAPNRADVYNVTMYIARQVNEFGYPDFVNAIKRTFRVPVSERESPSRIIGYVRDMETGEIIAAKGVVYALDVNQGNLVVARAIVNATTGFYNITGLYAGTYILQASAGVFTRADGTVLAYSLTESPFQLSLGSGQIQSLDIYLDRAPQIFGSIIYRNSTGGFPFQIRPITDNAWFQLVGVTVLNYTVEARDSQGNIYRNSNVSQDVIEGDTYRIIVGTGTRFVGYPSYGTEFAGLPRVSISGSAESYTVNAWIYGYLQDTVTPSTVTIDGRIERQKRVDFIMTVGGLIAGLIRFFNPITQLPESPRQAEQSILGTTTDKIFGGNILIQVFDATDRLRGVTVYNATLPDGTVTYATELTVRFYVLGFSEFYNTTYSGIWRSKDYGLGTPRTTGENFQIRIFIRGYIDSQSVTVFLPTGGMYNATYDMLRGSFIQVEVTSYNTRTGTRVIQSAKPWILLGAPIPPRIRVYFYDENGVSLGYVEKIVALGLEDVTENTVTIKFAGMNWSIREIIYFGLIPSGIREGIISIKAYTMGYVQERDITVFAWFGSAQRVFMALLIANTVTALVPLFADESLFTSLADFTFARLELYDSSNELRGVNTVNFTAGTPMLNFTVLGFGGLPHFFYADPNGDRLFDYGIDTGVYGAVLPDFGFTWRRVFTQFTTPSQIVLPQLQYQVGVVFNAVRLGLIFPGPGVFVRGYNNTANFGSELVELSWVLVEASNTVSRHTTTLDGNYTLHVPAGTYTLRFSVPGYVTKEYVGLVIVDWSDIISWDPSPLEQSGAPFPARTAERTLELNVAPTVAEGNSSTVYLLSAHLQTEKENLTFRWTVSGGTLNATEGRTVLWTAPPGVEDQDFKITCRVYQEDALIAEKSVTIIVQGIPEFSAALTITAFVAVLLVSCVLRRRPTHVRPIIPQGP